MCDIKIDLTTSNKFEVFINGQKIHVEVTIPERFLLKPKNTLINNPTSKNIPQFISPPPIEPVFAKGEKGILAPMPGVLIGYKKKVGDSVKMGDPVIILEAMKMYNNLYAPCDGIIKKMPFNENDNVKKYDTLCVIEAE